MAISINRLPDNLLFQILEKVELGKIARFRQCCRYLDSFVEHNRFEFSKRNFTGFFLHLEYENGNLKFEGTTEEYRFHYPRKTLQQAYQQLSAMPINRLYIELPKDFTKHQLDLITTVLTSMRISVHLLEIASLRFPDENDLSFMSLLAHHRLHLWICGQICFSKAFSLSAAKRAKILSFLDVSTWDEFHAEEVVRLMHRYEYMKFQFNEFNDQGSFAFEMLRRVTTDLVENKITDIPEIMLLAPGTFNILEYLPKMQLIWRKEDVPVFCTAEPDEIYAMALPTKILIVDHMHDEYMDNNEPDFHHIGISLIEKTPEALKQKVETLSRLYYAEETFQMLFHYIVSIEAISSISSGFIVPNFGINM